MQTHIPDIVVDHIILIYLQVLTQTLLGVYFYRMKILIIYVPEQCCGMEREGDVGETGIRYKC